MVDKSKLLGSLEERVPFRIARRILVASGFPSGQGWDAIKEKLSQPSVAAKADFEELDDLYRQTLISTEKAVRVFDLSAAGKSKLQNALEDRLTKDSSESFTDDYPYCVSNDILTEFDPSKLIVVGKEEIDDAVWYLLSSIHVIRSRIEIPLENLTGLSDQQFDEVYGIHVERKQSFDAVRLPKDGNRIFVLVDEAAYATADQVRGAFSKVRKLVKDGASSDLLKKPRNLFPLIDKLYDDDDLDVIEFNHTSTDTSMRHEKMRGRTLCLRQADFHKSGMEGVGGKTDAFGIGVGWDFDSVGRIPAKPELRILGGYSITHEKTPKIKAAHIGKCATVDETGHVLSIMSDKLGAP